MTLAQVLTGCGLSRPLKPPYFITCLHMRMNCLHINNIWGVGNNLLRDLVPVARVARQELFPTTVDLRNLTDSTGTTETAGIVPVYQQKDSELWTL